jgi:pyruvate dehydrogenase E1 component alpha subunit
MDPRELLRSQGLGLLETMMLIRQFESRVVALYGAQEMRTPVHLCIGQEAVPAGVCAHLADADRIFSSHRCHGHYLAKGGDLKRLAAELYCRAGGCSGGKGGSMHLVDPAKGVCGTTAIVGGSLPVALGGALASQLRRDGRVCVCFFGDGASEEGSFHESLNIAALKKLPLIFVQENNLYATSSHVSGRQAYQGGAGLAPGYGIPARRLDGNDALAVSAAVAPAIERARQGGGPAFFEFLTYRWMDHVGPADGLEKGYRSREEWEGWVARCPVERLSALLAREGVAGRERIDALRETLERRLDEAFAFGRDCPWPSPRALWENV